MEVRIDGKVALVTGAGHGMGRASALAFAEAGATVAIADVGQAAAEDTAEAVAKAGGEASPFAYEATDDASVAGLVRSIVEKYGRLDILMNCVGGIAWQPGGMRPTNFLPFE